MSRTNRPSAPWHFRRDDRDPGLIKPSASKRVHLQTRTGRTSKDEQWLGYDPARQEALHYEAQHDDQGDGHGGETWPDCEACRADTGQYAFVARVRADEVQ